MRVAGYESARTKVSCRVGDGRFARRFTSINKVTFVRLSRNGNWKLYKAFLTKSGSDSLPLFVKKRVERRWDRAGAGSNSVLTKALSEAVQNKVKWHVLRFKLNRDLS